VPLGPTGTQIASAELAYANAETELDLVLARAELEVATLRIRVQVSAARLEVAQARSVLAQNALMTEEARFELGAVGALQVMQARAAAIRAEGQTQAATADYLLDLMALAVASGHPATEVIR
jgi:outer membrane protein TolC